MQKWLANRLRKLRPTPSAARLNALRQKTRAVMKNSVWAKAKIVFLFFGLIFVFAQIFAVDSPAQTRRKTPARTSKKKAPPQRAAQTNLPKVTQIDTVGLK